ncbi:MAG: hypothetical protein OXD32_00485 [Endozoicomonadaceae bacterium]|nr:hypothetical protein [Endozoicomonadaceae bacterium]
MGKNLIVLLIISTLLISLPAATRLKSDLSVDQQLCKLDMDYAAGKTKISDDVYDGLILLKNQQKDSEAQPLNCQLIADNNYSHSFFMGSLRKAISVEQIRLFINQIKKQGGRCVLQPKIDGLAVELIYHKGCLVAASTRGNGYKGRDIYPLIQLSGQIPKKLYFHGAPLQDNTVLHGELYLRLDLAEKNKLKNYQHARHKVAGLTAQKKPDKTWAAWLDFYPWSWVNSPHSITEQDIQQLSGWGFNFIQQQTHYADNLEEIESWRQFYEKKSAEGPMLMDGVVLKANQKNLLTRDQQKLMPDYALAWKFPPKKAVVRIKEIYWTTGRTGKKTAILSFEPVILGGLRITKVSAGGIKNMRKLAIRVGDVISIALKGQAIAVPDRILVRTDAPVDSTPL